MTDPTTRATPTFEEWLASHKAGPKFGGNTFTQDARAAWDAATAARTAEVAAALRAKADALCMGNGDAAWGINRAAAALEDGTL